jgi:hypothetical protein
VNRWPESTRLPLQEQQDRIAAGETVHAVRDTRTDNRTLCETDGPPISPDGRGLVLDLADPDAPAYTHTITCPACLAWMHA